MNKKKEDILHLSWTDSVEEYDLNHEQIFIWLHDNRWTFSKSL
jgi:hypothetical protein